MNKYNVGTAYLVAALTIGNLWNITWGQLVSHPEKPFVIRVVDQDTGRPVPLVEITTVHHQRHITDNHGVTSWPESELQGQDVFFQLKSHGYEFQKDGFGYAGVRLKVETGKSVELKIKRLQIAQRLYRITGAGKLAESQLAGLVSANDPAAITRGMVTGQDSVQMTRYKNRLHWMWGDTNRLAYPLGNFHMPSATTELPDKLTWNPANEIPLQYFVDKTTGFVAETCRMPGDGPTWLSALASVSDRSGVERLVGWYSKIRPPMTVYRRGIAVWNDELAKFENVDSFDPDLISAPEGAHDLTIDSQGTKYLYFCDPFPFVRVSANFEDYCNPASYECYTCMVEGTSAEKPEIHRDSNGNPSFQWRRNVPVWNQKLQDNLIKKGLIRWEECPIQLKKNDGKTITTARGSVAWNEYRKRWVMIFGQLFGESSVLGEIWYAESNQPTGPWKDPVKILTHDKYSFYNVTHHPELDSNSGREIFIEGTYTATFSGNENPTPRYDYNQILFKLDLSDPRLENR